MMKALKLGALALAAGGAMAATVAVPSASAAIVCNGGGVCWHVHGRPYAYRPEYGVTVHPNNWRWGANDHYSWREHRGRGYWRDNAWVPF